MFSVNVPASTTQACIVPVVPPVNDSQTGRSGSSGTGNGSGPDVAASAARSASSRLSASISTPSGARRLSVGATKSRLYASA